MSVFLGNSFYRLFHVDTELVMCATDTSLYPQAHPCVCNTGHCEPAFTRCSISCVIVSRAVVILCLRSFTFCRKRGDINQVLHISQRKKSQGVRLGERGGHFNITLSSPPARPIHLPGRLSFPVRWSTILLKNEIFMFICNKLIH